MSLSHLPDRISVLADLSCTLIHRFPFSPFLQVVDSHMAIIETNCHQIRVLLMNVHAHDARTGGIDVLRKAVVL